jgi:glycosyltransferase involved in cell wall biosynthesis
MKILLLGEFSAFHSNLKEGLLSQGHEVTIASSGDGWKKINSDIKIGTNRKGVLGKLDSLVNLVKALPKLKGYDVVQFIDPVLFPKFLGINKAIVKFIFSNNRKIFLVAAGATSKISVIADFSQNRFKYPQLYQEIKKINPDMWSQTQKGRHYNTFFLENINGVIPIMHEYAQGFRDINYPKLCPTIPIPMNIETIKYKENIIRDKIVFFHGLNREGMKGTPLISKAMKKLEKTYPNEVKCIIDGRMPLEKYLCFLETVNVVIDQAYSVSVGVNGVYNLAMGKVVVGGGEPEFLSEFNLSESPLMPIKPDFENIYQQLEWLVKNKNKITNMGLESRKFSEALHDYKKVASQYIDAWSKY